MEMLWKNRFIFRQCYCLNNLLIKQRQFYGIFNLNGNHLYRGLLTPSSIFVIIYSIILEKIQKVLLIIDRLHEEILMYTTSLNINCITSFIIFASNKTLSYKSHRESICFYKSNICLYRDMVECEDGCPTRCFTHQKIPIDGD